MSDLKRALAGDKNLSGADLAGAYLEGADLSGAKLYGANLDGIIYNDGTGWPEGFKPPASV